jgi:hypothetical protein
MSSEQGLFLRSTKNRPTGSFLTAKTAHSLGKEEKETAYLAEFEADPRLTNSSDYCLIIIIQ